jgi:hypothetical protein
MTISSDKTAPNGMSEDGYELWKVVGEVEPMHSRASAGISRPPP